MSSLPVKPQRTRRRQRKRVVRTFGMTVSSFHYDERKHQPVEYEMYFNINRAARTRTDIKCIQSELAQKGRRHLHYWLLKHLNVRLDRPVKINFEKEKRAEKQVEQAHASVQRLVMRRANGRWEARMLPSGKMRFARRPRRRDAV